MLGKKKTTVHMRSFDVDLGKTNICLAIHYIPQNLNIHSSLFQQSCQYK